MSNCFYGRIKLRNWIRNSERTATSSTNNKKAIKGRNKD